MARRPHDLVHRTEAPPAARVPFADAIEVSPAAGLAPGCYRLVVRPYSGPATFHGTLRVEQRLDRTIASGDLYRYPRVAATRRTPWMSAIEHPPEPAPPTMSRLGRPVRPLGVPAHPPRRYDAYLRVTALRTRPGPRGRGRLAITCEAFAFTQPGGGYGGAFAPTPRDVTFVVEPVPRMPGYTDVCLAGTAHDERGPRGRVTLGRVTSRIPDDLAHLPAVVVAACG
jgi:hypothetical protein